MMEVGYDVLVSACTAILLAFMVAKLVSMAVCSGGEELLSGVGNGGNRTSICGGDVDVVKSDKRLKVDGLKIKKKKVKSNSDDRDLVSELIAESAVAANRGGLCNADDDDDARGFGSVKKDIRFLGADVDTACPSGEISSAGEVGGVELCVIQEADDRSALDRSSEGLKEAIGRPIEGFDQVNDDSARDLDELIGHDDSGNFLQDDAIVEETLNCDFQEKKDDLNGTKNREVNVSVLKVDCNDEHRRVSESAETQWKDQSEQVDDEDEVIGCSVSKDRGEMEISDGEEWEGIEMNELERDFAKAMNFVQCSDKEGGLNKLGSDVLMEFECLQKAAIDGVCLDLPTRAKWNTWTKSGSMNQEEAMEKYIALLSEKVPGWMDELTPVEGSDDLEEDGECVPSDANLCKPLTLPLIRTDDSKTEEEHAAEADRLSSVNKEEE